MSMVPVGELSEAVRRAAGGRVTLLVDGAEIALLPAEDLKALEELEALEENMDAETAREALSEGPAVPYEQFRRELEV